MSPSVFLILVLGAPPAVPARTLNCRPLLTAHDITSVCGAKKVKRALDLSQPRTDACNVTYELPPRYAESVELTLGHSDATSDDPAKELSDSPLHTLSTTIDWHTVAGAGDAAVAWQDKVGDHLGDHHVWLLAGPTSVHMQGGTVCTETQLVTLAKTVLSRVQP